MNEKFLLVITILVLIIAAAAWLAGNNLQTKQCGNVVLEGYLVTGCAWQMYPYLADYNSAEGMRCNLDVWFSKSGFGPGTWDEICSSEPITSNCFLKRFDVWREQGAHCVKVVLSGEYEKMKICRPTSKEPFPEECKGKYEAANNPDCIECKEENVFAPCEVVRKLSLEDESAIKNLVLDDIPNHENVEEAKITFEKIDLVGDSADVDIMLNWGPVGSGLCVGYNYKLSKSTGSWKIASSKQTIIC